MVSTGRCAPAGLIREATRFRGDGPQTRGRLRSRVHALTDQIFHNIYYATLTCRSPIETSPASPIEMSRSTVWVGLVGVAWDDGDHDEPQGADPSAGADRCC